MAKQYVVEENVTVQIIGSTGNYKGVIQSTNGRATLEKPYVYVSGWPVLKPGDYIFVDDISIDSKTNK